MTSRFAGSFPPACSRHGKRVSIHLHSITKLRKKALKVLTTIRNIRNQKSGLKKPALIIIPKYQNLILNAANAILPKPSFLYQQSFQLLFYKNKFRWKALKHRTLLRGFPHLLFHLRALKPLCPIYQILLLLRVP